MAALDFIFYLAMGEPANQVRC